jgi:hypothetical protein
MDDEHKKRNAQGWEENWDECAKKKMNRIEEMGILKFENLEKNLDGQREMRANKLIELLNVGEELWDLACDQKYGTQCKNSPLKIVIQI